MSSEVHEGQILAGKFRIERVLGRGGMGVVVAATHLQLDERVALKFLLPDALSNPEAVERFAREARAAVKIKSEHVARVSDVGTLESGSPYMVMEYLEGQDLAAWVRAAGAMTAPEAIEFLLQACEAIAEAHALGIVHRDLKPANLFVTRRADGSPCIKVLDFGISKVTLPGAGPDLGMTKTTSIMGSPLYMSPEQMSSTRNVDMRTDIWALGVILYETLTGRVPFDAETMPQLCGMILQDPPRPLRDLRPDVSEALQAVVFHCLEKKRENRFSNVADLAFALAPFGAPAAGRSAERIARVLGAAGITRSPELIVSASSARPVGSTATNWGTASGTKRSRAPLFAGLGAFALLLGGGALALTRRHPPIESLAEPVAAKPIVTALLPAPVPVPAPKVSASPVSAPQEPLASAAPVASSKHVPIAGHSLTPKPKPAAPGKPVAVPPTAPAVDPLDGRR
jgi:serine/threonine-protein kinase